MCALPAPRAYSVASAPATGPRISADPELVVYPTFDSVPRTAEEFYARADQVADLLHQDEAARDRGNVVPYRQVQLLKDSSLTTVLGPEEFGGGGQSWEVAYNLVRIVARGDGSLGQLLGYHYVWYWAVDLVGTDSQVASWHTYATQNKLFFGGAVNPRDADLTVSQDPSDPNTLVFNGHKTFSTGSKVSDYTIVEGVFGSGSPYEGQHVFAAVRSKQSGITYGDGWVDTLGMRGTQSGGIRIEGVKVPFEDAFGWVASHKDPNGAGEQREWEFIPLGAYNTLNLPLIQLVFVSFYLGITEGALARALEYTVHTTRAWPYVPEPTRVQRGSDEAYIQIDYGTLQSKTWAVAAFVQQVITESISVLHGPTPRTQLTAEQRGQWAIHVAAAKVAVAEVGLQVTTQVWELQGARSISAKYGFDVAFRDLRTHLLHDPIAHKKAEVGRFALFGVPDGLPIPTWYT